MLQIYTSGEDQAAIDARQAGSDTPVLGIHEPPECVGCLHQTHGQSCDLCRHNSEPDPDLEVQRLIKWLITAITEISVADDKRIADGRPLDDAAFLVATGAAASGINDDSERLVSLLDSAKLAGEVGVEQTLEEGGQ